MTAPISPGRALVAAMVSILIAFLVQTAALPALGAPAWIPVVWTAVAVAGCRLRGDLAYLVGFAAGLLLDTAGSGPLGGSALIGVGMVFLASRITTDRSLVSGVLRISGLVVSASVLQWLIAGLTAPVLVPSAASLALLAASTLVLTALALGATGRWQVLV